MSEIIKKDQGTHTPTAESLVRFFVKYKWFFVTAISLHYPFKKEFIELYADQLKWSFDEDGLSSNKKLQWSESFIERYIDRWNWYDLSENEALPWSVSLIERYSGRWHWEYLGKNEALWEKAFQPYVTDAIIEQTMKKI